MKEPEPYIERPGRDRLWQWFSLSYASWLTLPRVLMHEMPDDWQDRMAQLLEEYDDTFTATDDMPAPYVTARDESNHWCRWPRWLLNYRHPDRERIEGLK